MTPSTALARPGDKAFVWLTYDLPDTETWEDAKVFTVDAINNYGDVAGTVRFAGDPAIVRGFVYFSSTDAWHLLPPDASTQVRGINDDRTVVGWTGTDDGRRWVYDDGYAEPGRGDTFDDSEVWGIDNNGNMVGVSVSDQDPIAWYAEQTGFGELNPLSGGNATAAYGLNNDATSPDACGESDDSSDNGQAVVWPSGSVNASLLPPSTNQPWDVAYRINDNRIVIGSRWDSGAGKHKFIVWTPASASTWNNSSDLGPQHTTNRLEGGLNNSNEIVVISTFFYYDSGGTRHSIAIEDFADIPLEVQDESLYFEAINENGWIAGYTGVSPTDIYDRRMVLLIPRDDNNNSIPDYREIIAGDEPDTNGDWVLDWTQLMMRVGLHAPNSAIDPEGAIDPAQIIRLGVNVGPLGIGERPQEIEDEDWISDIVNPELDCDACVNFHTAVTRWGAGVDRPNGQQSEILIRVHSMMGPVGFGAYEALPDPDEPAERQAALDDLRLFAYRFARCIDYLQWGNESFGGARQYVFRGNEFEGACIFTGTPKAFSQLSDTCKQQAIALVLAWQKDMMRAALEGSALAGRPLRMTSCGVFGSSVRNGYDADNAGRYLVSEVSEWCNENQMYFSLHNHYETVADATDAIKKLVGLSPYTSPPWDVPDRRISTEVGARANFDDIWWTDNNNEKRREFARYFFTGDGNPSATYETFVNGWLTDANGQWDGDGAQLDIVFDTYADAGFAGICWSALQYDPGTSWQNISPYLIEGLRATQVRNNGFFESGNGTNRFTPLKTAYEDGDAGGKYGIADFAPHAEACDLGDVCPGCQ